MPSDLEPKMLENICRAIDDHSNKCNWPPTAIALNADDRDELDWDEIRGLPIIPHDDVMPRRFRILCDKPNAMTRAAKEVKERELTLV